MKLASYIYQGRKSYGIYTPSGFIDLGNKIGHQYATLKDLLQWDAIDVARQYLDCPVDISPEEIIFLPVIEEPGKIFCVGMNYAEKRKEFAETNNAPTLFIRFPDSQTGHARPVIKPVLSSEFDYEGELAVIVGKPGSRIDVNNALSHVAGYSCYMDGSVRDWQHAWFTAGKNWTQTGAFGPYMTTADEIPDPHALTIHTWLNGMLVQNDSTGSMIQKWRILSPTSARSPPSAPATSLLPVRRAGSAKSVTRLCLCTMAIALKWRSKTLADWLIPLWKLNRSHKR